MDPLDNIKELLYANPYIEPASRTPENEFDGDASPEALAAWGRYGHRVFGNGQGYAYDYEDLQDTFTDAWDTATRQAIK